MNFAPNASFLGIVFKHRKNSWVRYHTLCTPASSLESNNLALGVCRARNETETFKGFIRCTLAKVDQFDIVGFV